MKYRELARDQPFTFTITIKQNKAKFVTLMCLFLIKVRSLRLRLLKTDRIDTNQFHITSVQDDQSEIKLSSGSISVDLLHRREMRDDEGIISITLILFRVNKLICHDKAILN